eukprot:jgi/Chlat1/8122/Chrsp75S07573
MADCAGAAWLPAKPAAAVAAVLLLLTATLWQVAEADNNILEQVVKPLPTSLDNDLASINTPNNRNNNPSLCPVWPMPKRCSCGTSSIAIAPNFQFTHPAFPSPFLQAAIQRYAGLMFDATPLGLTATVIKSVPSLQQLRLSINSHNETLTLGTDESYTLNIGVNGSAALRAKTVYGLLRGLETFSQLVSYDYDRKGYYVSSLPIEIEDAPRFVHRGLLIDTARHYLPKAAIKKILDSMSYAKLVHTFVACLLRDKSVTGLQRQGNCLHWHMIDTQSFPLETKRAPKLWDGAWSKHERYTTHDVTELLRYAQQRGIRVVPEFDMPGHAASWGVGYPETWPSEDCREPLDPSKNATWELITSILRDAGDHFTDSCVHLGGDEVDTSCWSNSKHIQQWLSDQVLDEEGAYKRFVSYAANRTAALGRTPIFWEEVFNLFGDSLHPSTIVHVWFDRTTLPKAVQAGYRSLLSHGWYLDHLQETIEQFYLNEPHHGIDAANHQFILGGEVCMWGETADASDIEQTIWPRAAAAAERLWSPRSVNDIATALPRLERFRCMLLKRGVAAAPVHVNVARQAPPGPGSCTQ